jgi:hypothetical protein
MMVLMAISCDCSAFVETHSFVVAELSVSDLVVLEVAATSVQTVPVAD